VDADALPYIVGYTSTEEEYLRFKRDKNPYSCDIWQRKIEHINYLLSSWLNAASCDAALLYLTDSANNFRNEIGTVKVYKGQRKTDKPPFFSELKQYLRDEHDAKLSDRCEADDEISIEAWRRHKLFAAEHGKDILWTKEHKRFSDFVIISKDKDLKIIPGMHLPPDSKEKEWVDPIGYLAPKYKETEVIDYEYWPLFKATPIDPRGLVALVNYKSDIVAKNYDNLKCNKNKWEKDYVWNKIEGSGLIKQDCYVRGVNKGLGKFKRIKVGMKKSNTLDKLSGAGLKFFYSQLITGDSVDNYCGIPGYGPKKAFTFLEDCTCEKDLIYQTSVAYLEHYSKPDIAKERLVEQARLAWMLTEKGELWSIPKEGASSFPT
jgi:hypothetical protein